MTGWFSGDLYVNGTYRFSSAGLKDSFLLKLDEDGAVVAIRRIGGTDNDQSMSLTLNSSMFSDDLFVGVTFQGTTDFGGGPVTSSGYDCVIARYNRSLSYRSLIHMGGSGSCSGPRLERYANTIYAVGSYTGLFRFLAADSQTEVTSLGYSDVFVAAYSTAGSLLWSSTLANAGAAYDYGVSRVNDGIWVVGDFNGQLSGPAGAGLVYSAGGTDGFAARFGSNGVLGGIMRLGTATNDHVASIDVDHSTPHGNVAIVGGYVGLTTNPYPFENVESPFGDYWLFRTDLSGYQDAFVLLADQSGYVVSLLGFGSPTDTAFHKDNAYAVAYDPYGGLLVGGVFYGTLDTGMHSLTSHAEDGFVFHLTP